MCKIIFKPIFLLSFLTLIACSPTIQNTDHILNDPCHAPCWQGIIPGTTSGSEISALLKASDLIDYQSLEKVSDEEGTLYLYALTTDERGSAQVYKDKVVSIGIKPESVPLGEIVANFGNPDLVFVKDVSSEYFCYEIRMLYLDKGIQILTDGCPDLHKNFEVIAGQMRVDPNMLAYFIEFHEPNFPFYPIMDEIKKQSLPWSGFGYYKPKP